MHKIGAFACYSGACFGLSSLVYLLLRSVMPGGYVFGLWFRMPPYHYLHPFQYIGVVAICYGILAAFLAERFGPLPFWKRVVSILGLIFATLLVSSIPGGILWTIHDMQAGFVPSGHRFWDDLFRGAANGLRFGWLILALSIPYNLVGMVLGVWATDGIRKRLERGGEMGQQPFGCCRNHRFS